MENEKRRYEFECAHCKEIFSKLLEFSEIKKNSVIMAQCPFCSKTSKIDFRGYHGKTEILRGKKIQAD